MSYLAFLVSFVCFAVMAMAGLWDWNTGDFDGVLWGLTFLALGHFLGGGLAMMRSKLD